MKSNRKAIEGHSLTPETDAMASMQRTHQEWRNHAETLERERDALRKWIMQAAPVMESAICIAIEENVGRIGEIPGCQALMEQCPLDWVRMDHII